MFAVMFALIWSSVFWPLLELLKKNSIYFSSFREGWHGAELATTLCVVHLSSNAAALRFIFLLIETLRPPVIG